jgi:hypothetical protein
MPEMADDIEPYIYTSMVKFNLGIGQSKRLAAITNNKIEQL